MDAGFDLFRRATLFNFYAFFALTGTLLLALNLLPWVGGRMQAARQRARETGELNAPTAEPLLPDAPEPDYDHHYRPHLVDFLIPIGLLLGIGILPYFIWGSYRINEAFLSATLSAMLVARVRGLPLSEIMEAFVDGCRSMTIGAIVLGLAVTLGAVAKELQTAAFLIATVGSAIPAWLLPALLTFLCMGIAFSTGTSWGTYAVVFPVAVPLAASLSGDPTYLALCFGAVLGGAVFGDQCSPISDTTILSSMFTGCDLMDHVQSQLPLALAAALLACAASTAVALLLPL